MDRMKFCLLPFLLFYISIPNVLAHCPLCTAATGSVVAVTRWYGVDDIILGTFIGGFLVSGALWINNFLRKRNKNKEYIPYQSTAIILFSITSTIATFYVLGLLTTNVPAYLIFGISKLLIGTLAGTLVTLIGFQTHYFLRKSNKNKNYIPFQGIMIAITLLSVTALGFYILVV